MQNQPPDDRSIQRSLNNATANSESLSHSNCLAPIIKRGFSDSANAFLCGIAIIGFGISGCSKPPPPAPPPQNVVVVPAPVAAPAHPATTIKTKSSRKGDSGDKKSPFPPGTDPKTMFVVSRVGEPMEIEPDSAPGLANEFAVVTADVASNSMTFTVTSNQLASQSQSLIGSGQAKSSFNLAKGFKALKEYGYSSDGLPMRITNEKTKAQLALVRAGTSVVGCDDGPEDCKPSFKVRLDAFYMEVLEVTVEGYELYRTEMREKKKTPPPPSNLNAPPMAPALGVSWGQAQNYAHWAGMELPTEAEFEKAARGPTGFQFPWGDGKALLHSPRLSMTGSNPEDCSPYGIMDLAGNAKEWCSDFYSANAHKDATNAAAKESLHNWPGPKGVKDPNLHVVKGSDTDWRCWHREGRNIAKGFPDVGFRCVLKTPN